MQYRPLGDSGITVSALGLGTWAMGATPETWGLVDDNESIAAIHAALDLGVNLIDTAPIYGLGHSEQIVGRAVGDRRDQVVLATKCGLQFPGPEGGLPRRCLAPAAIGEECEASLRRLGTDHLDLYQCHWPDPEVPISDTMGALVRLREQGKIRAIGVSNFSVEQLAEACAAGPVCSVQPSLSLIDRRAAAHLLPYCESRHLAVLPYSPLGKGILTGKFNADTAFEDVRSRDPEYIGARYAANLALVEGLRVIARHHDRTVSQVALNFLMNTPGVTAPLFGAKRPSQVRENVGAADWSLPPEDRARVEQLLRERDQAHVE